MLSKFFSWVKTLLKRLIDYFKDSKKKEGEDVLNKEMLLWGGAPKETFKLTVGQFVNIYGFNKGSWSTYGSITPTTINNITLVSLHTYTDQTMTTIGIQGNFAGKTVTFTRMDTGLTRTITGGTFNTNASVPTYPDHTAFNVSSSFFTSSDNGKTIEIYVEVT